MRKFVICTGYVKLMSQWAVAWTGASKQAHRFLWGDREQKKYMGFFCLED